MVKGNGFAPYRKLWLYPQAPPTRLGWISKMIVQWMVRHILYGQTPFAFEKRTSGDAATTGGSVLATCHLLLVTSCLLLITSSLSAQCTLVCNSTITVTLDTAGQATIYPPMLLQSSQGCSNNFDISVVDTLGNEQGTILGPELLGMPLTATLTHPASGNSCETEITLVDISPPDINCTDTLFIWCNEASIADSLGFPEISDNATETDSLLLEFADVFTELECFDVIGGEPVTAYIERTWTVTDESGNENSCTQHVFLKRVVLSQIVFPDHRDGVEMPELECGSDDPNDLSVAGQPTVEGLPLDIAGSCELIVSHSDQEVPICGGSKKIIRTWTVFDLCTEDFRVYAQIIRVIDTTPPAVTCPDNVSFNTFSSSCTAQVWLPAGTAEDACSGASITPSWTYGTGYGPYNSVPAGTHTVTYTGKDGCNNTATCQITVTVKDAKKPTALCELLVQVNLEEDGTALVFAETFNNGSYDNCQIAELLVKKHGTDIYDEFVSFDCSELNTSPVVSLKVVDEAGLVSECTSNVTVLDLIQPDILCPAPITINCGENYNDPGLTGNSYATDNCTVANVDHTDLVDLNNCGNGTVMRTWRAIDQSGNLSTCQQEITISDNTDIAIVFPDDHDIYECQPNLDPSLMGEPVVTGQDCEQLQITHTDYYFYTAEPACYQLIRNWAIVDWCSYTPNNPQAGGFWEHTQIIEVRDSVAPVLTCPQDFTVGIDGNGCETFVDVPLPEIDDCSNQLTITNNSSYAQSNTGTASGVFPKGLHNIKYTVSDGCGNTSSCSFRLEIQDSEAPNPVCNNGVSVTIQQNGYVTLTPSMINAGSWDNCTATSGLVMQVSPNTFTCQDLGTKVVTLTVTDQSDNSAFCQTNVVIQDNFDICGNGIVGTIAGKLETASGEPLSQKLVGLTGGITMAVHTDVDGTFDFPNLPLEQSYTLKPAYNTNPLNGVTTYDMVVIRRHILGVEALGSPYKMIAADVNRSGSVTTFDLVEMRKLILNISQKFPNNNPSWRFVPASYVFPNPENPFNSNIPNTIFIENLLGNLWEQDFVGIKVGDVNESANPANFAQAGDDRNTNGMMTFRTQDKELVAGREYAIPFVATSPEMIAGFQFTLDFDAEAVSFTGVEAGVLTGIDDQHVGRVHEPEGMVTVSWENTEGDRSEEGDVLFALRFTVRRNSRLQQVLHVNSRITPAEGYTGDLYAPESDFEVRGIELEFEETVQQNELQLFQNTPNPFFQTTNVSFYLPEATNVTLRIFNIQGQNLKTYTGSYTEGQHTIPVFLDEPGAGGILLCQLEAEGFPRKTIRMMNEE